MPSLLQLSSVETFIGGSRILRGVNLEISAGEVVALMGRNGVGKTTTLRSITGVLPVRAGVITLAGERIDRLPSDVRARAGIGYVPQGREIFPHLTVEENLQVGLVVHRRKGADARAGIGYVPQGREIFPRLSVEENLLMGAKRVPDAVFAMFPVLKQMLGRRGGDLSGGQQQQLAIGRALAMKPRLLILDEPTEGIQPSIIKEIERAIRSLAASGEMAILLVEQYYDFARSLADQYLVMERGEIVARGAGSNMEADGVKRLLAV